MNVYTQPTYKQFQAIWTETPDDFTSRLVCADWMQEMGSDYSAQCLRNEVKHHHEAVALHERLKAITDSMVEDLSSKMGVLERHCGRRVLAAAIRKAFSMLKIKGVQVKMDGSYIDINLPVRIDVKHHDYHTDYHAFREDPANVANREAEKRLKEIVWALFPSHEDRSDSQSDHFDFFYIFGQK